MGLVVGQRETCGTAPAGVAGLRAEFIPIHRFVGRAEPLSQRGPLGTRGGGDRLGHDIGRVEPPDALDAVIIDPVRVFPDRQA